MLIDCARCEVRGLHCDGCVVTALLEAAAPDSAIEIDEGERQALETLAAEGMLPPLRLVLPDAKAS